MEWALESGCDVDLLLEYEAAANLTSPGRFGAAVRLGVPATTLESKIKALGIDKRRFKAS